MFACKLTRAIIQVKQVKTEKEKFKVELLK